MSNNTSNGRGNGSNFKQAGALVKRVANNDFFSKIEKDFSDEAENVIVGLGSNMVTTNQVRNILSLVNGINEKVFFNQSSELSEDIKNEIKYIKVKLMYDYGRGDRLVKEFIDKSKLIELSMCIKGEKQKFKTFASYVEALIAYHKFYGNK